MFTTEDAAILERMGVLPVEVAGSDHRASARIGLDAGANLVWREVVVLGRHGEPSGSLLQRLRVDVGGRPLVRHDVAAAAAVVGLLDRLLEPVRDIA